MLSSTRVQQQYIAQYLWKYNVLRQGRRSCIRKVSCWWLFTFESWIFLPKRLNVSNRSPLRYLIPSNADLIITKYCDKQTYDSFNCLFLENISLIVIIHWLQVVTVASVFTRNNYNYKRKMLPWLIHLHFHIVDLEFVWTTNKWSLSWPQIILKKQKNCD